MLTNVPAEKALLGLVLSGLANVQDALPLPPEDFTHAPYAALWRALCWMDKRGQGVDPVALVKRLKDTGDALTVGDPNRVLVELTDDATLSLGRVATHAKAVREAAHRRAIRDAAQRTLDLCVDPNVEPAKAALDSSAALAKLGAAGTQRIRTFTDSMSTLIDRLDDIRAGRYEHYLPTGIAIWDDLLGGLARGIVTLLPAYPGVGKGAVAGRILLNLAQNGRKSILFSLEDPEYWVAKRFLSDASGIPVRALMQGDRTSDIRDQYLQEAVNDVVGDEHKPGWGDNMLIDDRSGLSADQIAATARQAIVQNGCECIVIDNASEVDVSGDERHDVRTAHMVRVFRDVAKDHNIPVLLLMHLKKNGNASKEGAYLRPTTELLKNTTGFAEVARAIVALWRDENSRDEIIGTILKQTEGERDIDFTMRFNASAGLVESFGGSKREQDKGYTDAPQRSGGGF